MSDARSDAEDATPRNPYPTVDVLIEDGEGRIYLIKRKNPPHGWAIPGGFVDYGEPVEVAAAREALEETSLQVEIRELLGVYSDPSRDARKHTMSTVFVGEVVGGTPQADDDAAELKAFAEDDLPEELCFDHAQIIADYLIYRRTGQRPLRTWPRSIWADDAP